MSFYSYNSLFFKSNFISVLSFWQKCIDYLHCRVYFRCWRYSSEQNLWGSYTHEAHIPDSDSSLNEIKQDDEIHRAECLLDVVLKEVLSEEWHFSQTLMTKSSQPCKEPESALGYFLAHSGHWHCSPLSHKGTQCKLSLLDSQLEPEHWKHQPCQILTSLSLCQSLELALVHETWNHRLPCTLFHRFPSPWESSFHLPQG